MSASQDPKASVLVIDDEKIVHESVGRILEGEGFQVDGALRVDEALKKLSERSYDVVLTDLMMPDDSGMKAVEAVARDHPGTGVVMFTGFATVESAVESMKLGALDYLPKPFTPDELLEVTEKALAKTYKARRDIEIEKTYAEAEKAMSSSLDLKELLGLICSSVVSLFRLRGSALYMHKKKEQGLEMITSRGLSEEYLGKGELTAAKSLPEVLETGETVFIDESEFDSTLQYPDAARKEGIATIVSVPLKVKDTVLGEVRLYSSEKRSFEDEEIDLLNKFAEQAARAVENAMSYEEVRSDIEGIKSRLPGSAPTET